MSLVATSEVASPVNGAEVWGDEFAVGLNETPSLSSVDKHDPDISGNSRWARTLLREQFEMETEKSDATDD